jgi:hypothetical protein
MMYRCKAVTAGLLTVQMMRAAAFAQLRRRSLSTRVGRTKRALNQWPLMCFPLSFLHLRNERKSRSIDLRIAQHNSASVATTGGEAFAAGWLRSRTVESRSLALLRRLRWGARGRRRRAVRRRRRALPRRRGRAWPWSLSPPIMRSSSQLLKRHSTRR